MINKLFKRIIPAILALILLLPVSGINALSTVGEVSGLIDGIVGYKVSSSGAKNIDEWIEGEISTGAGKASDWYAISLCQYKDTPDMTSYVSALEKYISENSVSGATARQRIALALIACGLKNHSFVLATINDSVGKQGIMSYIYGLHLLNNGVKSSSVSATSVIKQILSMRKKDGGWALMGDYSDCDVTAMTIQALSPYMKNEVVSEAVNNAVNLLSGMQKKDGGFASFGKENPESCAQVIVALCSLGIDPGKDSRFIKGGKSVIDAMLAYKLSNGSFCHEAGGVSNETATFQALYSLVSYYRLKLSLSSLYLFKGYSIPKITVEKEQTQTETQKETQGKETKKETEKESKKSTESSKVTESVTEKESSTFTDIETNTESVTESVTDLETESVTESDSGSLSESVTEEVSPEPNEGGGGGYKVWVCLGIVVLAAGVCAILLITGRKNKKNFIFVLIVSAVLIIVVLVTNISSKENYFTGEDVKAGSAGIVTMEIRCDTVAGQGDSKYIPEDGVILAKTSFPIDEGDTVFDVLTYAAKKYNIQMENKGTLLGTNGMIYISGINYLYEFDFGELSGWIYHVNGYTPSYGCGEYVLKDGDSIEWLYSLSLGEDVRDK